MVSAGKYAREAVIATFHNIGGVERMTEVAEDDPKWFFEKLFSKTIIRESEVETRKGIEDVIDALDNDAPPNAVDAEFEDK